MKITYCENYENMSALGASLIRSEVEKKKNLLLCTATGSSPMGLYKELVEKSKGEKSLFQELRVVKLDEWGGVLSHHKTTCEYYLKTRLLNPLGISSDRYISFDPNPSDPIKECRRIQDKLNEMGPIDVCVLGLGKNGHLGLNEPDSFLKPYCHVSELSQESLDHSMVRTSDCKPKYGLTLGIKNILIAKKIILLVTGIEKDVPLKGLLQKRIRTDLPASFLWLHNHVECIIDQSACI